MAAGRSLTMSAFTGGAVYAVSGRLSTTRTSVTPAARNSATRVVVAGHIPRSGTESVAVSAARPDDVVHDAVAIVAVIARGHVSRGLFGAE